METVFRAIGIAVCGLGGALLCFTLLGFLAWLMCCVWVELSNKFRDVCKAESLIFEYRKYRERFLAWMSEKEGKVEEADEQAEIHQSH